MKLVIIGSGGFAREAAWLAGEIREQDPEFPELLGFIAPAHPESERLLPLPRLGDDEWAFRSLDRAEVRFVIATGSSALRAALARAWEGAGFTPGQLIHPAARQGPEVRLGPGAILCAGSVLTTHVEAGRHCLINLNCTLGHDCRLGDFVTLAPGVHLSGQAQIGEGCELGTGAVVLPAVRLGKMCKLGAGAVAARDLEGGQTYVGVPARPLLDA